MTVLVTGTAGFIGYHVARALLEQGREVVGYDNLNPYYSVALKQARHQRLAAFQRFTAVEADLCRRERLEEVFRRHAPRLVCHLAAQAGVRYSLVNPHAYEESNLAGFLNVLEMCRHFRVERLVYASSSSVYGGQAKVPFSEEDRVDHPVSLYAATKKANELMACTYTHLYGLPTVGLRLFTVYGPWGRPDMAIWLFTEAIRAGRPIQVFGHGAMRRDFTYVDDAVRGILAALDTSGLAPYEIFNIGNNQPEQLLDLIAHLEALLGKAARKEMLPMQPGDVPATWADIGKAHRQLGFDPATPLLRGLERFVAWYTGEWASLVKGIGEPGKRRNGESG